MKIFKKLLSVLLVVVLIATVFPVTASAYSWGNYGDINVGQTKYFDLGTSWGADMYSFTPSTTGYYTFYSYSKSAGDPYFYLSTSYSNIINSIAVSYGAQNPTALSYAQAADDDTNGSGNFYVKYWCTAGTTYYCILTKYSTTRTIAYFTVQGPYYNYATLNNQSANTAGTTGYYNDTGYQGFRAWTATNSTSNITSITKPTKTGYTFGGYYTGTNGSGTQYIYDTGAIRSAYHGTLYAKWTANNYTLTFDKQLGSGGTSSGSVAYGGQIPASISVPTRSGYTFGGYYTQTGGGGTQYYNAAGTRVYTGAWPTAAGATIYAKWSNDTYTLTLNNQGVANGAASLSYNEKFPVSVTVPSRTGYNFKGYYADLNGVGTQYYNENGARVYNNNWTEQKGLTIYASWERVTSSLTIDLDGGTWSGGGPTFNEPGTTKKTLPDPVNGKKPFLGWTHSGGGSLSGNLFTFGSTDATLTANWGETPQTEFTDTSSLGASTSYSNASDLEAVFDHVVAEPEKGITAEDLSGNNDITLSLIVADANESSQGASDISAAAQGQTAFFLDISVEKKVGSSDAIKLSEIPVPVEVKIPLPVEHQGKLGYSVYRYHDGQAERLSGNTNAVEYFEVRATEIVIYTRKFSTYAVVVHEFSVLGNTYTDPLEEQSKAPGWDVQALVREGGGGDQYKVDIVWGAMTFDYSVSNSWNPETHQYDGEKIYAWLEESCYHGGNNKITAYNHSNVDVSVTFDVVSSLSGVDMEVYAQNSDEENVPLARDLLLVKVPGENAAAPFVDAYLYLSGTPDNVSVVDGSYEQAGFITVTVAALPENGTTPAGVSP